MPLWNDQGVPRRNRKGVTHDETKVASAKDPRPWESAKRTITHEKTRFLVKAERQEGCKKGRLLIALNSASQLRKRNYRDAYQPRTATIIGGHRITQNPKPGRAPEKRSQHAGYAARGKTHTKRRPDAIAYSLHRWAKNNG